MSYFAAPRQFSQQNLPFQRPISQGGLPRQITSPQVIRGQNIQTFQRPTAQTPSSRTMSRPVSAQGASFSTQQNFYPAKGNPQFLTSNNFYASNNRQIQQQQQFQQRQQPQQQQRFNVTSGYQYQPQKFVYQQPGQVISHKKAPAPQSQNGKTTNQQQQQQNQNNRQNNFRANLSPSPLKTPAIDFQPKNKKAPKQVLVPASMTQLKTPQKQQNQIVQNANQNFVNTNNNENKETQNMIPQQQQQLQREQNSSQKKQFVPVAAQVDQRGSFRSPRIYNTSAQKPQQRQFSQQSSERAIQKPQFIQMQQQLQNQQQKQSQSQNNLQQQQQIRSPSSTQIRQPITAKNQANFLQYQPQQQLGNSRQSSLSQQNQVSPVRISRAHSPNVRIINQGYNNNNQSFQNSHILQNHNQLRQMTQSQSQNQLSRSKAPEHILNMDIEPQNNKPSVLDTVTNQFTNFLDNLL